MLEEIIHEYEQQENERRYKSLKLKLEELCVLFNSSIQLVQIIAKFKLFGEGKMSSVSVMLQKLCHLNLRDDHGNMLLHRAVEHKTYVTGEFPCIDTVKLLLNAGINVNAINNKGDTPLHKAVTYIPSNDKIHLLSDILQVLFNGGAHHDFVNNDGKTAMDMAQTDKARKILSEKGKLELMCISARAVKKFGLRYSGVVPKKLEKYISMH